MANTSKERSRFDAAGLHSQEGNRSPGLYSSKYGILVSVIRVTCSDHSCNNLIFLELAAHIANANLYSMVIIESVDSISRDGPDTPIIVYVIQNKKPKYSVQIHF